MVARVQLVEAPVVPGCLARRVSPGALRGSTLGLGA